jgi:crotonobetainyl-CoA:carnitine CoA-transferase CaiB-like acyl-CoA transferase
VTGVQTCALPIYRYAFYNTYETKDHRYIAIGCLEPRFWIRLCQCLGKEDWIELQFNDPRRFEIIEAMRGIFKMKDLADWEAEFEGKDICWGRVNSIDDVLENPLFIERGMVNDYETENGKRSKALGIPVKMSGTPGSLRTPPTSFGRDTEAILIELGYSGAEINVLKKDGIL